MNVVEKAKKYALDEISEFGLPSVLNLEFSAIKGVELAKKLKADKEIVLLGCYLMDIKLGEALKKGKLPEHVKMGSEAAKKFLDNLKIDESSKAKVINCVEAHHGGVKFNCTEAEICANADCYRFIHPKGFLGFLNSLGKSGDTFEECLKQAEDKMDEKYKILSLDICKKELENYYKQFKKLIADAKTKNY